MHTLRAHQPFHSHLLCFVLSLCIMVSCSPLTSTWADSHHIVGALQQAGIQVGDVVEEKQDALTDLKASAVSFSITNTRNIVPSGFIFVFAEERQARLFSFADEYYRQYPESAKYRFVRNRNAVLLVKEQIPEREVKGLLDAFQAMTP